MDTITKELEKDIRKISHAFHDVGIEQSSNCWSNFSLAMFLDDELDHLRTDKAFKGAHYSVNAISDYLANGIKLNKSESVTIEDTINYIGELPLDEIQMMKNCLELLKEVEKTKTKDGRRRHLEGYDIVELKYQLDIMLEQMKNNA